MASTSPTSFVRKVRIALTPSFCWLTTRLESGVLISGKNKPGFGSRGAYLWREDYEPELRHLGRFLPTNGVLIDIGANSGIYSMQAAKIAGEGGAVIAVEPSPLMIGTLWRNIEINRFNNVRIRQFCVSDSIGEIRFWMNHNLPNSFSLTRFDEKSRCFSALAVTVDHLVEWEALKRLDYIKIDAEGAEPAILRGAASAISRFRPVIQVEDTLASAACPQDYRLFRLGDSPNLLYVPAEHPGAGWLETNAEEQRLA